MRGGGRENGGEKDRESREGSMEAHVMSWLLSKHPSRNKKIRIKILLAERGFSKQSRWGKDLSPRHELTILFSRTLPPKIHVHSPRADSACVLCVCLWKRERERERETCVLKERATARETHAHAHINAHMHTHTHAKAHINTHTHTHTHTYAHINTHTHAHKHTHTCACKHTHTCNVIPHKPKQTAHIPVLGLHGSFL